LLSTDSQILERCYTQYFAYNNANCPVLLSSTQYGYYTLTPPTGSVSATSYVLRAVAVGNQTKDTDCEKFSIDQTGNRTATNQAGASNPSCWGS
ncbi:MAG: type IV pilin protein, partial [Gammaproteobacteria bacterium]|nr:type IV pilin protein [Gammaproteobacteria bacterium]